MNKAVDQMRCPNEACEGIGWYTVQGRRTTCPDCNGTGAVTQAKHDAIVRSERELRLDVATGFSMTPDQLRVATEDHGMVNTDGHRTDRTTYDVRIAETVGDLVKVVGTANVYKSGSIVDTFLQESWVADRPEVVANVRQDMLTRLIANVAITFEEEG